MASIHMYSPRKTSHISNVLFIVVSFFSSISVMVHGQPLYPNHIFVCLRYLSINRLSFSPWCHLDLPCPKPLYLSKTSNNPGLTELTQLAKVNCHPNKYLWFNGRKHAHSGNENSGTGLGLYSQGSSTVPFCQSKNSEVLNTFHPSSGRGLTMPLEKVWRNTWSVNSSGWLYCKSLCVQEHYCHARRTERQGVGALGIIYGGSSRDRGIGGRGGKMWRMYCATVYVVWPQDRYLTTACAV